ncbi:hypothetical protein IJ579_03790, partial [bacterium]|nr:hypothetical protein [bacterium]
IILSYDKKCISDPDSVKVDNKQIHSCVAGIYDFNGSRKPNLYGGDEHTRNDLISFNGAKLKDSYIEIGGVKIISQAKVPTPAYCEAYMYDFEGIYDCAYNDNDDYWVGALVECKNQGGRLPNASELAKIARAIYNDNSISESGGYNDNSKLTMDENIVTKLGIKNLSPPEFALWSSIAVDEANAWGRYFDISYTEHSSTSRNDNYLQVICIAD